MSNAERQELIQEIEDLVLMLEFPPLGYSEWDRENDRARIKVMKRLLAGS